MNISLTYGEYYVAVQVGVLRFMTSEAARLNHASTYQRSHLERLKEEVVGACGEMAFSKAINKPWDCSVNTFHDRPDVSGVEIRTTDNINGCLIIRDNDSPERWYYLVVGEPPNMRIVGSIQGHMARRPEYLRNPNGHRQAWFVPQSALIPFKPREK